MKLSNDIARCDGLLPKSTHLPDGTPVLLYSIDCPHRDNCARFCQTHRDDPTAHLSYCAHHHAPTSPCPFYIPE
jgi:hypothetical protein